MIEWILSEDQKFPDGAQQVENYKRNGNNEYLAVIKQKIRNSWKCHTVPVNLWDADGVKHLEPYWTITGTDDEVVPIKWALMPKPTEC